MALFMISYDLHKQRDYAALLEQLQQWGCVRPLESVWLAELNSTAGAVRDTLKNHVDSDDSLLVLELKKSSGWATRNVNKQSSEWLKEHIS